MINRNQPAFPSIDDKVYEPGITIRQYFASKALQGLLANRWILENGSYHEDTVAELAVRYTDYLLKELDKQPTTNEQPTTTD